MLKGVDRPVTIDTGFLGCDGLNAAYFLPGSEPVLIGAGDAESAPAVAAAVAAAGLGDPRWILLTHGHAEHAGGVAELGRRFPEATVLALPEVLVQVVDPARPIRSIARAAGTTAHPRWVEVPALERKQAGAVEGGARLDLGGRRIHAISTPGHVAHHLSFFCEDSGTLFAGDALGVRLPGAPRAWPAINSPEFDLAAMRKSIAALRALEPESIFFDHFGRNDDGPDPIAVDAVFDGLETMLDRWTRWTLGGLDSAVAEACKCAGEEYGDRAPQVLSIVSPVAAALAFQRSMDRPSGATRNRVAASGSDFLDDEQTYSKPR